MDLLLPPSKHILRRDVARRAVQPNVVVVVHVSAYQAPWIEGRRSRLISLSFGGDHRKLQVSPIRNLGLGQGPKIQGQHLHICVRAVIGSVKITEERGILFGSDVQTYSRDSLFFICRSK